MSTVTETKYDFGEDSSSQIDSIKTANTSSNPKTRNQKTNDDFPCVVDASGKFCKGVADVICNEESHDLDLNKTQAIVFLWNGRKYQYVRNVIS